MGNNFRNVSLEFMGDVDSDDKNKYKYRNYI